VDLNLFDAAALAILVFAVVAGIRTGALPQVGGILGAVASLLLLLQLAPWLLDVTADLDPIVRALVVLGILLGGVIVGEGLGSMGGRAVADGLGTGVLSGLDRFAYPAQSEVVIICDADACLMREIDELLEKLHTSHPTVAGLMAHYSPCHRDAEQNNTAWHRMLDAADLKDHPLSYRYSIATPEQSGRCPAYFNYGFVAFNRAGFEKVRPLVRKYKELARTALTGHALFFAGQIGLALALAAAGVDVLELGPQYNCPNSNEMLGRGIDDVTQIRFLHFLRNDEFDRHSFLSDPAAFHRFSSATFDAAVNRHFQRHVLALPQVFYFRPAETDAG